MSGSCLYEARPTNACSVVGNFTQKMQSMLQDVSTQLLVDGTFGTDTTSSYIADGAWLDASTIPALDESTFDYDLPELYANMMEALAINYAWIQQVTYIVQFPMTEDECQ